MASKIIPLMDARLKKSIEELKTIHFSEIELMPEYSDIEEIEGKVKFTVATWVKRLADGSMQVVVQAYKYACLGMGTMLAEGFVIETNGNVRSLPEEVLFEYK